MTRQALENLRRHLTFLLNKRPRVLRVCDFVWHDDQTDAGRVHFFGV